MDVSKKRSGRVRTRPDHFFSKHHLNNNKNNIITQQNSPIIQNLYYPFIPLNSYNYINYNSNNNRNTNTHTNSFYYYNDNPIGNNGQNNNNNNRVFLFDDIDIGGNREFINNKEIKIIKNNLNKTKIRKVLELDKNKKNCLICLEYFKKYQNVYILSCSHIFHVQCFNKEIKLRQKCPICRISL